MPRIIITTTARGDRGNIAVVQDDGQRIYLYTHWGGSGIASSLQRALAKHWRWRDTPYLTRIIYDELVGSEFGQETGFGISTDITDNEHPILVVDPSSQTVTVEPYTMYPGHTTGVARTFTFEEFAGLDPDKADELVE